MTFEDAKDPRNGPAYHTGEECVEKDCERPAGTAWSPFWCFECNVERMHRISGQLNNFIAQREGKP
jgi:hypothetical protein